MKSFKYKFSTLSIVLMCVGILLSIGCIVLNLIKFIQKIQANMELQVYDWLTIIVVGLVAIAFLAIVITMMISSKYVIKDNKVILYWGFITNTINLDNIVEMKHITNKGKLILIYKDDSYFIIVIKEEWFEDFINSIKDACPSITFTQETVEEDKKK